MTEEGDSVVNIVNFTRFLDLSLGVQIPVIIIVRVTYLSLPHCSFLDTKKGYFMNDFFNLPIDINVINNIRIVNYGITPLLLTICNLRKKARAKL